MADKKTVQLYTDGACSGNPGPGGWGCILSFNGKSKEMSGHMPSTTNNRMELMAAIAGLEALKAPCNVTLYSDSKYLVDAFRQKWIDSWIAKDFKRGKNEPVKNPDLWKRLLKAKENHNVEFVWVKGHAGHAMNEKCDMLATSAADGDNLADDVTLENIV